MKFPRKIALPDLRTPHLSSRLSQNLHKGNIWPSNRPWSHLLKPNPETPFWLYYRCWLKKTNVYFPYSKDINMFQKVFKKDSYPHKNTKVCLFFPLKTHLCVCFLSQTINTQMCCWRHIKVFISVICHRICVFVKTH